MSARKAIRRRASSPQRRRPVSDVALLAVDIGNTRLRAARFEGGRIADTWEGAYDDPGGWSRRWRRCLWQMHALHDELPVQVASVAPRRSRTALRALTEVGFSRVHTVTVRDLWPFRIDVDNPQTIGVDRLANVAGAVALGLNSAIVLDLGTAITVDVLDQGVFHGGLIMPGLSLQARALHEHTEALPLVDVRRRAPDIGRTTPDAVLAGMTHMTLAGLAATARRLAKRTGGSPILLTGGWAERLQGVLRGARHEPHLLFQGLQARARLGA